MRHDPDDIFDTRANDAYGNAAVTNAHAQERSPTADRAFACVNAVFNTMRGTWGLATPDFDPDLIPGDSWQISRYDATSMLLITSGQVYVWRLTERGADQTQQIRDGWREISRAVRQLSCQESLDGQPAMLETIVEVVSPAPATHRERIRVTANELVITRLDPEGVVLLSEKRMQRYNPAPSPMLGPTPRPAR